MALTLLVFLIFLGITGALFQAFIRRVLPQATGWRAYFLGIFLSLTLLGIFSGLAVLFFRLTPFSIGLVFLAVFFFSIIFHLFPRRWPVTGDICPDEPEIVTPTAGWVLLALFLVFAALALYFLYHSRTGELLATPWQTIAPAYIYIYALLALLSGSLVFSKLPSPVALFLFVVFGLVTSSYLPLTHDFFYGADQWRHLAVEKRIVAEMPLRPPVLRAPSETLDSSLKIGENNLSLGSVAYASFWGLPSLLNRVTGIGLLTLNKWLGPVLWSIFFPILLFNLGRALGFTDRPALFLVWLGFLPFALHAPGSLTLPVSYGFLFFVFSLSVLAERLRSPRPGLIPFLFFLGLLSLFSYSLYAILFFLGWGMAEIVRLAGKTSGWGRGAILSILVIVSLSILPAVELTSGYSQYDPAANWRRSGKELAATISGWRLAAGPTESTLGNIIFNQPPPSAFVPNIFTVSRWWLVGFMVLFLSLALLGLAVNILRRDARFTWLAVFSLAVGLSYVVSRYFLAGENIFTRRLDPTLALFLIVLLTAAFIRFRFFSLAKKYVVLVLAVLSAALAASYSLGPDTLTVSAGEYAAMEEVWREAEGASPCVVAGFEPLLALEAISSKNIIGGGFPIDQYFAQPELTALLRSSLSREEKLRQAVELTGAERCALVDYSGQFGEVGVWWYP